MRQFKSFLFTQCQHCYDCIPIKSHATDVTEELGIDSPMILIGEEGYPFNDTGYMYTKRAFFGMEYFNHTVPLRALPCV